MIHLAAIVIGLVVLGFVMRAYKPCNHYWVQNAHRLLGNKMVFEYKCLRCGRTRMETRRLDDG